MIKSIDKTKKESERNIAIIETLYGCGLRVSELIELKISDLYFSEDFIKVTGKGNKQRLIPISEINKIINEDGLGAMGEAKTHSRTNPKNG